MRQFGDGAAAGTAVAVAEYDVATFARRQRVERTAGRRHRVAIDQQANAEPRPRRLHEVAQGLVVGRVKLIDAPLGVVEPESAPVDAGAVGNDLGDGAETGGQPRRGGGDVIGKRVVEHGRIELVGLAVDIDIGAREMRLQQRRAELGDGAEYLVDEGVFGAPEPGLVECRLGDEAGRVTVAAMRRGEHHRRRLFDRPDDLERRCRFLLARCFPVGVGSLVGHMDLRLAGCGPADCGNGERPASAPAVLVSLPRAVAQRLNEAAARRAGDLL